MHILFSFLIFLKNNWFEEICVGIVFTENININDKVLYTFIVSIIFFKKI